jgi:hypothetical protein
MTLTEKSLHPVLNKAWNGGFKTKSDFARIHANQVAVCASLGFITTRRAGFTFGTTWLITKEGLEILKDFNECY